MGVTMDGTKQQRRGNTLQRIQDVALEPFAEQDYGKTSLRGIAERLDVTKTALYDNFRTKEEIIVSLFEDVTQPVQDLIEWGRDQPHTLDAKQEFVRRYSVALAGAEPLFRFMQSQATVRELRIGDTSKDRMRDLRGIFIDREAPPRRPGPLCQRQVTLHAGMFVM
jgi:AcrR family transcriptional regulator